MKKDQRIYIRISHKDKEFLKYAAKKLTKGNINALFELFVKRLKEELEEELYDE